MQGYHLEGYSHTAGKVVSYGYFYWDAAKKRVVLQGKADVFWPDILKRHKGDAEKAFQGIERFFMGASFYTVTPVSDSGPKKERIKEGGPGSGNWRHKGRKGQVGGSQPGGGKGATRAGGGQMREQPIVYGAGVPFDPLAFNGYASGGGWTERQRQGVLQQYPTTYYGVDPTKDFASFEQQHMGQITETCRMIAANGEVMDQGGDDNTIMFSDKQTAFLEGGTSIHNHPMGTAPSPDDFRYAVWSGQKQIVVVGRDMDNVPHRYTVTIRKMPETEGMSREDWVNEVGTIFSDQHAYILHANAQAIAKGKMTAAQGQSDHWHKVWEKAIPELRDVGFDITYTRETITVRESDQLLTNLGNNVINRDNISEGGPGSGNWHHAGRKGKVGGSQPGGGAGARALGDPAGKGKGRSKEGQMRLVNVPTPLTSKEKLQVLRDFEQGKWNQTDHETMRIITSAGDVYDIEGGESAVSVTTRGVADAMIDADVTHNHPSGSGFSPSDVLITHDLAVRSMTAFGTDAMGNRVRYTLRPDDTFYDLSGDGLKKLIMGTHEKTAGWLARELAEQRATKEQCKAAHWHVVMQDIADALKEYRGIDMGYRREIVSQ